MGYILWILGSVALQIIGIIFMGNDDDLGLSIALIGSFSFIASLIAVFVKSKEINAQKRSELEERLAQVDNFTSSQKFISVDNSNIISIDAKSNQLCIVLEESYKVFNYNDILESEIIIDGASITKVSRSNQLGGALVGGVLAGGVGAVIGGLSGKSKTTEEIKSIQLKIIVNSTQKPIYYITFLNHHSELNKDDIRVKNARKQVDHWHGLISVLIKRTNAEFMTNEVQPSEIKEHTYSNNQFVADELLKLSELVKQGLITQEEFEKQKLKLLA